MKRHQLVALTALALLAFAGNSLLCRAALRDTGIDAGSFTAIRLCSGALVLWLLVRLRLGLPSGQGSWLSALALFTYAATFSFAYLQLSAATGALLLFGAVQASMIGWGLVKGERLSGVQSIGLVLAISGLIGLLLPGLSAPPVGSAVWMIVAGIAWGIYSLRGRGAGDPTRVTAGNFLRTVPMALLLALFFFKPSALNTQGIIYAMASGAITSGMGYALWYAALPLLRSSTAATLQLSVPVITAAGGMLLLGEPPTWRLLLSALTILGGIALVIRPAHKPQGAQ